MKDNQWKIDEQVYNRLIEMHTTEPSKLGFDCMDLSIQTKDYVAKGDLIYKIEESGKPRVFLGSFHDKSEKFEDVALKLIKLDDNQESVEKFKRRIQEEIKALKKLQSFDLKKDFHLPKLIKEIDTDHYFGMVTRPIGDYIRTDTSKMIKTYFKYYFFFIYFFIFIFIFIFFFCFY
jgi:hypothetical protein